MRWTLVPALLVALPTLASAQRMAPAHFAGAPGFRGAHFHRGGFPGSYYPLGSFDPYFADYLSDSGYARSSQPQVIVLQSPQPSPAAEPSPPPSQPLMIELQGDRYVQISGDQSSRSQTINASATTERASRSISTNSTVPTANPTPTAVLIFRDGHREEVSGYTIADGRLYITSNYTTTGFWIQRIELSSLNLPETVAANNVSGHKFQIPSAPNEVIVGP